MVQESVASATHAGLLPEKHNPISFLIKEDQETGTSKDRNQQRGLNA